MLGFGAFAPLAPRLTRRVSIERVLARLRAADRRRRRRCGARAASAPLFAGCALAGLAVAIAQAVLPVFIRLRHPELTGLLTGAYSMSLTLGATLAAALAVPLRGGARLVGGVARGVGAARAGRRRRLAAGRAAAGHDRRGPAAAGAVAATGSRGT